MNNTIKKLMIAILVLGLFIALSGIGDSKISLSKNKASSPIKLSKTNTNTPKPPSTPKVINPPTSKKSTTPSQIKRTTNTNNYNWRGRQYHEISYNPGFDYTSLLLMGYILSHDDQGRTIYINNNTSEIVRVEEPKKSPGLEGIFAIAGILAIAYLILRREE
jgi:hypothetical protein